MAYDWKKFEPFRFWCNKVLPLIYDDSLSYYETLCKLYALVTKLIELCNELIDAVKDLDGRVTVLEQTVDLLNQELVKLKTRMDNVENKVENLETTVENIQKSITNIMNTLNEYGDRITQVEGDITEINKTLLEVSNSITNITTRVINLEKNMTEIIENPYTLPIASATTLGGIKVGNNLTIRADGTLDAQAGGGSSDDPEVKKFYFSIPTKTCASTDHSNVLFEQDNNYVALYIKGNQVALYIDPSVKYMSDSSEYTSEAGVFRETFYSGALSGCTQRGGTGFGTLGELVELLKEKKILGSTTRTFITEAYTLGGAVDYNVYGVLSFTTFNDDEPEINYTLTAVLPRGVDGAGSIAYDEFFLASGGTGGGGGSTPTPNTTYSQERYTIEAKSIEKLSDETAGLLRSGLTIDGKNTNDSSWTSITDFSTLELGFDVGMCTYNGMVYVNPNLFRVLLTPKYNGNPTDYDEYLITGTIDVTSLFEINKLKYMLSGLPNECYIQFVMINRVNENSFKGGSGVEVKFEYTNGQPKVTLDARLHSTSRLNEIYNRNYYPLIPIIKGA